MKPFDYIRFGLKNIWRQKSRTVLTIFAVMIGATSVVAMLTLVFTAKDVVIGQITSAGALTQVTVSANTDSDSDVFSTSGGGSDGAVKLTEAIVADVAKIPHVQSATPTLSAWNLRSAVLKEDPSKKFSIDQTVGVDPAYTKGLEYSAGRALVPTDTRGIIIGSRYLAKMGYKANPEDAIGKTLQFQVKGYMGPGADIPKPIMTNNQKDGEDYWNSLSEKITVLEATVVGVLSSPVYDGQAFIPMAWARDMQKQQRWEQEQTQQQNQPFKQEFDSRGTPKPAPTPAPQTMKLVIDDGFDRQGYSVIIVKVDSTENVPAVAQKVKDMKLGAATAEEMIAQLTKLFNLLGLVLGAIGAISLGVAAIGVINTMVMATLERTREIGVLRACGATRSTVRRLFTFEAALLGFWGGVFGVAVGYGIAAIGRYFGADALGTAGISAAVIQIPLWLALATIGVTTLIGTLAGLFPAIRAARMNPVEALRYE